MSEMKFKIGSSVYYLLDDNSSSEQYIMLSKMNMRNGSMISSKWIQDN